MGETTEMMLDGTLCQGCGVFLNDDPPGHPCSCRIAAPMKRKLRPQLMSSQSQRSNTRCSSNPSMKHLKDIIGATAFVALLGLANALASNAGEYAAPTTEEIESDIQTQRIDLCNADGWPDDDNSKLAYERACRGELHRPTTKN